MKLHLGCGEKHIPGWIHVDIMPNPHIDIVHKVDWLPMVADNEVETIYACHILEHFERRDVQRVLGEWYRILKPGGILRLAVPDFNQLTYLYKQTGDLNLVIGPLIGRQNYLYNYHYNLFDELTLEQALIQSGYRNIHKYNWWETEHADLDDFSQSYYPHMQKDTGTLLSLNVEATK